MRLITLSQSDGRNVIDMSTQCMSSVDAFCDSYSRPLPIASERHRRSQMRENYCLRARVIVLSGWYMRESFIYYQSFYYSSAVVKSML